MVIGIVRLPEADAREDLVQLSVDEPEVQFVEYSWFDVCEVKCDILVLACGDICFSHDSFPLAKSIGQFATKGGFVLGIGGGFYLLCKMGLLPGQIVENRDASFVSRVVYLRSERTMSALTSLIEKNRPLKLVVSHSFGRFKASVEELRSIRQNDQIIFRYCDAQGKTSLGVNVDGSVDNIAAIANEYGNVFGMMAHPERSFDPHYNGDDGLLIFRSLMACIS